MGTSSVTVATGKAIITNGMDGAILAVIPVQGLAVVLGSTRASTTLPSAKHSSKPSTVDGDGERLND